MAAARRAGVKVAEPGYQRDMTSRDRILTALSARCHPETLRRLRWANAMLKTLSPQVLAS